MSDQLDHQFEDIDLSFLPGAESKGARPAVRALGSLAREFREEGGPPPLPRPAIGLVDGVALPLLYPGLNALGGVAGTGKSVLMNTSSGSRHGPVSSRW
jgi:hypothetical protein